MNGKNERVGPLSIEEISGHKAGKVSVKKRILAAATASSMLLVGLLGGATAANAASAQNRTGLEIQAGPSGSGTTWLGSMWLNQAGGAEGWCIEWGTPEQPITVAPSDATQANVNYQITTYKNASAADQAAVAYNVHQQMSPSSALQTLGYFLNGSSEGDAVKARAAQIQAEANNNVGPYKMAPNLIIGADGRTGSVNLTSLITGNGTKLSGRTATAVLTGPAVFANGSKTITFQTGASLPFTATANGIVSVTTTVSGLPGTGVKTYRPANSQDMVAPGPLVAASGKSTDAEVRMDFQPEATSTAVVNVTAGESLTDVLHVTTSTGIANDWAWVNGADVPAVFDVEWYYSATPLPASKDVPAAAVKYAKGQGTANGVGNVTVTADVKADKPGFYYPVASFTKANQVAANQKYFKGDWRAGFNDPGEISINKYTPKVTTKTSDAVAVEGATITDTLQVSDNMEGQSLEVDSTLYGPFDSAPIKGADAPSDAPVVGTVKTTITGNGEFKTAGLKVPSAGFYVWHETINATGNTNPWTGPFGEESETTLVKWTPKVTTKTSAAEGIAGGELTDFIQVTGNQPNHPLDVVTTLYGPLDVKPVKGARAPEGTPVVATVTTKITGNGDFETEAVTLPASGYYVWAEDIVATDTTNEWKGEYGIADETTLVRWIPEVITKINEVVDGKVSDVVTVKNNNPFTELSIDTTLYLSEEAAVEGGQVELPKTAKVVGTVTSKIKGNGDVTTEAIDIPWDQIIALWDEDKNPTLYFSESIVATENTTSWTGLHLLPNESILQEKPSIITKASAGGSVPLKAHDTGVLSGTVPSGPTVKVETMVDLYKWDNSVDGSAQPICINPFWSSEWQTVTKTGEIIYPELEIKYVGTYGFSETLQVTVTNGEKETTTVLHKGKCGAEGETVIATEKPGETPPNPPENNNYPGAPKAPAPIVDTGAGTQTETVSGVNSFALFSGLGLALLSLAGGGLYFVRRNKSL